MEPIFQKTYQIPSFGTDRFQRLKLSFLLGLAQEMAGEHSALLGTSRDDLQEKGLFWAVIRNRVQITRLPMSGETITLETWPMPTTRVAYPRSTIAYDAQGQELFRSISLWVLMDTQSRAMVLPGKSGVTVQGLLRGSELAAPGSMTPGAFFNRDTRQVRYTELDINGHMNNTRYLDWAEDLLPSEFHRAHPPLEFTVCYLSEAREGEEVTLHWELKDGCCLHIDAVRTANGSADPHQRVFSAQLLFS